MDTRLVAAAHERVAEFGRKIHGIVNQQTLARTLDELVPGLVGNPFLPHWPHPKQLAGLAAYQGHRDADGIFEMLFGGAAGGGKSNWLLTAAAIRAARWRHYRCLILRRTHAEMMKAGAILSLARLGSSTEPVEHHAVGGRAVRRSARGDECRRPHHQRRQRPVI